MVETAVEKYRFWQERRNNGLASKTIGDATVLSCGAVVALPSFARDYERVDNIEKDFFRKALIEINCRRDEGRIRDDKEVPRRYWRNYSDIAGEAKQKLARENRKEVLFFAAAIIILAAFFVVCKI